MITLYDCATAPSPRRARILLAEKGVAHDTVQVDLRSGEQLGEAYRRINPQCTVPALRTEDGLLLTDNAAITAYIEARYPQPALLGETPAEKAEIASWNWRMEFEGLLAIAEALRNSAPAMANRALPGAVDYPQIPTLAERGPGDTRPISPTMLPCCKCSTTRLLTTTSALPLASTYIRPPSSPSLNRVSPVGTWTMVGLWANSSKKTMLLSIGVGVPHL